MTATDPHPATLSRNELYARLNDHMSRIESLRATIRSCYVGIDNDSVVWSEIAAKGACRYQLLWHGEFPSPAEDPRALMRLYNGEEFNFFQPHQMWYEVTAKFAQQPYTNKVLKSFFYECTGWWPKNDESTPPRDRWGDPLFLQSIFEDERCHVLPHQEQVVGTWCHVVEIPAVVRLWVDGFRAVVCQRDALIDEQRKNTDGHYDKESMRIQLTRYREIVDGVMLPSEISRDFHGTRADTLHHINYTVNDVDDSTFYFDPGPGVMVCDRDTDNVWQVPGGLSELETLAARGTAHARRDLIEAELKKPVRVTLGAVGFLAGCGMYRLLKGRVGRKAGNPGTNELAVTPWINCNQTT